MDHHAFEQGFEGKAMRMNKKMKSIQKIDEIDHDSTTSTGGDYSYILSEDSNLPSKPKISK